MSQDEDLAAAVSRLYAQGDPVPGHLLDAASSILAWREPNAALAALTLDSAVAGAATGVRGEEASRLLSFASGGTVIDVEVLVDAGRVRLVGQVSRPVEAPLRVRHSEGTWTGQTDAVGRFAVSDLPVGRFRISWGPPGETVCTVTFHV